MRYQLITLVDITKTNPPRGTTDPTTLGQQSNYNTLIQTIGLRANIDYSIDPVIATGRLPNPFTGKGAYWTFVFETEREGVFLKDADPVGLLTEDLNGVPIVGDLANTVTIEPAVFTTTGKNFNTRVTIIP